MQELAQLRDAAARHKATVHEAEKATSAATQQQAAAVADLQVRLTAQQDAAEQLQQHLVQARSETSEARGEADTAHKHAQASSAQLQQQLQQAQAELSEANSQAASGRKLHEAAEASLQQQLLQLRSEAGSARASLAEQQARGDKLQAASASQVASTC